MEQILVTVDSNQPLQNIRKAINMLRGVVSTTVIKEPVLTKTQKQQAFVKESLTRALQEVKLAKLEGRKLPDARDLLKDLEISYNVDDKINKRLHDMKNNKIDYKSINNKLLELRNESSKYLLKQLEKGE